MPTLHTGLVFIVVSRTIPKVYEYGIVSYLEPLIAALLGLFIYAETISLLQAVGCCIIFGVGIKQVFETPRKAGR